jgi:hypothetical protein
MFSCWKIRKNNSKTIDYQLVINLYFKEVVESCKQGEQFMTEYFLFNLILVA